MFAQIQQSFDEGMEGLVEEAKRVQEVSTHAHTETQREVASLREIIARLEAKVDLLAERSVSVGTAAASDGAAAGATVTGGKVLADPLALLEKVR
jgi:uncharacterized protein YbbK (DUF523 family)